MDQNGVPSFNGEITWRQMLNDAGADSPSTVSPTTVPDQPAPACPSILTGTENTHQPELPTQNHENLNPRHLAQNFTQATGNRVGILRNAAPPNTEQQSMNSPSSSLGVQNKAVVDPNDLRSRLSTLPTSVNSLPQAAPKPAETSNESNMIPQSSQSFSYGNLPNTPPPDVEPAEAPDLVASPSAQLAGSHDLASITPTEPLGKSRSFSEFGSSARAQLFERRSRHDSQPDPRLLDIDAILPAVMDNERSSQVGDAETTRNTSLESNVPPTHCSAPWFSTMRKKMKGKTPEDDDVFRGRLSRKDPTIEAANKYYENRKLARKTKAKDRENSDLHSRQTSGVLGEAIGDNEADAQINSGSRSPVTVKIEKKRLKYFLKFWKEAGIDDSPTSKSSKVNGRLKGKSSATLVDANTVGVNTEQRADDHQLREVAKTVDTLPRRLAKKISNQFKAVSCAGNGNEGAGENQAGEADGVNEADVSPPAAISQNKNSVRKRAIKHRLSSIFKRSREESTDEARPILQGARISDAEIRNSAASFQIRKSRLPPAPGGSMSFATPSTIPKRFR